MRALLLVCATLVACGPTQADCDAAKYAAHKAWGELGVKTGVDHKQAEDDLEKLESVLAVAESHAADAPPAALEAKRKEVADKRAQVESLSALASTADKVREAWRTTTAAQAQELAMQELSKFSGPEADKAGTAGQGAASTCAGLEK